MLDDVKNIALKIVDGEISRVMLSGWLKLKVKPCLLYMLASCAGTIFKNALLTIVTIIAEAVTYILCSKKPKLSTSRR